MNRFQNAQNSRGITISSIFRHFKRNLNMTLRTKIVNFGGFYLADKTDKAFRISKIAVMQITPAVLVHIFNGIFKVKMLNATCVEL